MKRILSICLFCALAISLSAQVKRGGDPLFYQSKNPVKGFVLPTIDNRTLLQEDMDGKPGSGALRMGVMQHTSISNLAEGQMETLSDGTRVWRLEVSSPGATFLALYFSEYDLPQGAHIFFYTDNFIIGGFDRSNRLPDGRFYTQPLPGDRCIIEYQEPAEVAGQGRFTINNVLHGYKEFTGFDQEAKQRMGHAGDCHINVACAEADICRDQVRSIVCLLLASNDGAGWCSGALINNTANDKTPYILSAYHCQDFPGGLIGVTCFFNYQTPTCEGNDGPNNQTVVGGEIVAKHTPVSPDGSDMLLLRLYEAVPDSYQAYYSGWDRTVVERPKPGFGIHHPAGDFKKISIPYTLRQGSGIYYIRKHDGSYYTANATKYYKAEWTNKGIIEGGSSGSPLFNSENLIIGQLTAGSGDCSDTYNAEGWYGRFSSDWFGAGTAETRVSDWLDPLNTNATKLKGINYDAPSGTNPTINAEVLTIFPNPNNGMVHVAVEEIGEASYQVYNTMGHLIYEGTTIFATQSQALNLTFLPAGVYRIVLTTEDKDKFTKTYTNNVVISH